MIQKFLTLGTIPQLRSDPSDPTLLIPEIEISVDVETFFELEEIIKKIKFARAGGKSGNQLWHGFVKLVKPHIIWERDRLWFIRNIGA